MMHWVKFRVAKGLRFAVAACTVWALVCGLPACGKPQERLDPGQFVGVWKSTRSSLPIRMHANGEWEIRRDDDQVYQYGLWRLEDGKLVWTFLAGGKALDDANPVLGIKANEFVIRELDGSATVFQRLPDNH